jgi:hypothetical protein
MKMSKQANKQKVVFTFDDPGEDIINEIEQYFKGALSGTTPIYFTRDRQESGTIISNMPITQYYIIIINKLVARAENCKDIVLEE